MKPNNTGIQRCRTECPECGAIVRYTKMQGVRRFQAKPKECPSCGEVFR